MPIRARRVVKVVDNRDLALRIGRRIRAARWAAELSQAQLAGSRYTPAYISALETGHAKPSMAALRYIADRLQLPMASLVDDPASGWNRLAADLRAAAGDWRTAVDAYEELLDQAKASAERAELQRALAEALCRLGQPEPAVGHATEASKTFDRLERPLDAAWARYWLAFAEHRLENYDEARSILDELLTRVRGGLDVAPDFQFRLLTSLGAVASAAGRPKQALAYLAEADAISADLDVRQQASLLLAQALNYQEIGDLEGAIRVGTRSMALFEHAHLRAELATMKNQMALAYLRLSQGKRALSLAREAEAMAVALDDRRLLSFILETEAEIALASGQADRAIELADRASALAEEQHVTSPAAEAALVRARAHLSAGAFGQADTEFERASRLADDHGHSALRRRALTAWADSLAERGKHADANQRYREALSQP